MEATLETPVETVKTEVEVLEVNAVTQTNPVETTVETAPNTHPEDGGPREIAFEVAQPIHPYDFSLLLSETSDPVDISVSYDDLGNAFQTYNGVKYHQTVEVGPTAEGQEYFDGLRDRVREQAAAANKVSLEAERDFIVFDRITALENRVHELEARIEDYNIRSGHKV